MMMKKTAAKKPSVKNVMVQVAVENGLEYQGKFYAQGKSLQVEQAQKDLWLKHKFIKP